MSAGTNRPVLTRQVTSEREIKMARKYCKSVLFEFIDFGPARQNRDRNGQYQNPSNSPLMYEVHVMLDQSDFENEIIIDTGSFYRQALSPTRSKPLAGYRKTHCSGDVDTRHVATIREFPNGNWGVITHPHGKSSGSVRYPYLGNATREDCEKYIVGYVNRRFKRLHGQVTNDWVGGKVVRKWFIDWTTYDRELWWEDKEFAKIRPL